MKSALIAAVVAAVVAAASGSAATLIITSKNIKNGTIQVVDISAKAKRALKGNRGPQGPAGVAGPEGQRGPSSALIGSRDVVVGEVPNTVANIGHVTLSPGNYIVIAKAAFVNPGPETLVECSITPTGQPQNEWERGNLKLAGAGAGYYDAGVITLVVHTIPQVAGLDFRCQDHGGSVHYFDQGTRAIQVGALQPSP
jgi:hypothetical protein